MNVSLPLTKLSCDWSEVCQQTSDDASDWSVFRAGRNYNSVKCGQDTHTHTLQACTLSFLKGVPRRTYINAHTCECVCVPFGKGSLHLHSNLRNINQIIYYIIIHNQPHLSKPVPSTPPSLKGASSWSQCVFLKALTYNLWQCVLRCPLQMFPGTNALIPIN